MVRFTILAALCLGFHFLGAQVPTVKDLTGVDTWFGASTELYFDNHSSLSISGNLQRSSFAGDRLGNSPFDETLLMISYQHFFKEKWQLRLSQSRNRIVIGRRDISLGTIQHNGRIGSLIFGKTLGVELLQFKDDLSKENDFQISSSVYLGKRLQLNNRPIQLGFRYEAFRNVNTVGDPRRISKTRFWFESQLYISNRINIGVFAMRETDYFFVEETFGLDEDGNMVILKPYRKLNLITPTYGIRLRFIIHPEKAHIGLPFNLYQEKK